jgi:hypothetical protein
MSKLGGKASSTSRSVPASEEPEASGNKPLAATLLQEFQNLKDNLNKFKNEDDTQDRGKNDI